MLAQEDENGVKRAIYYLSRVLNDVETRYSPVENLYLCFYFSYSKLKQCIKPWLLMFILISMLLNICYQSQFHIVGLENGL